MDPRYQHFRMCVLEHVRLAASAEAQLRYEQEIPIADVPAELVCGLTNELHDPEAEALRGAFTPDELEDLEELSGKLRVASEAVVRERAGNVQDTLRVPEWRAVMAFAQQLAVELEPSH